MQSVVCRLLFAGLFCGAVLSTQACHAGWRWWSSDEDAPVRYSKSWWEMKGQEPVGARQTWTLGKAWPPYPRPAGPSQTFAHKFHATYYWPHPYSCADRQYVREVSQMQTSFGWANETTLYDYHFEPETHAINKAGLLQLRWILEHAPVRHRVCFVQTAENSAASQVRLSNVQREAVALVGESQLPPIVLRVAQPISRPALEVDMIRRGELESLPVPRISDPIESGSAATELGSGM